MMQNNDLVIKQNIYLFNLKTSLIHPVKAHIYTSNQSLITVALCNDFVVLRSNLSS